MLNKYIIICLNGRCFKEMSAKSDHTSSTELRLSSMSYVFMWNVQTVLCCDFSTLWASELYVLFKVRN